ncbi:MAG: CPBP family intramembrane metalloprotease [Lewinella sp.]|nr:CPBP family intramembrane metalloprotease [Lewinella sp.]
MSQPSSPNEVSNLGLGYRLLGFTGQLLLFAAILIALVILFQWLIQAALPNQSYADLTYLYLDWSSQLLAALAALAIVNTLTIRLPLSRWGFRDHQWPAHLGSGLGLGATLMVMIFGLLWLAGGLQIRAINWDGFALLAWFGFFTIQPLCEEVIMRSFLQNQLHRFFGSFAGLAGTALTFMLLHGGNAHFSWLAALNILAGGWLLGLLYLHTQSIWAPFAFHLGWNFFQSTVLGFAVSGFDAYSLLDITPTGPAWLTGGAFGVEASLPGLLFLLVPIVYFWSAHRRPLPLLAAPELTDQPTTDESHPV